MSLFTKLLKNSLFDFLRKWKKYLIAVVIFISLLFGINIVINNYVDKVVGTLVKDFVREKSDDFYRVSFDDIAYILNDGRFYISNFRFYVNPDLPEHIVYENLNKNYIYEASIPKLYIDIRDFKAVFIQRKLNVIGIDILSPFIKIVNLNKDKKPKKISFEAGTLYESLSKYLRELKINNFRIDNGEFDYHTYQGADYDNFKVKQVTFDVRNFQVNKNSATRTDKFFYTDDISLSIKDQLFFLKDSIHQVSFDEFYISTRQNELEFINFKLTRREDISKELNSKNHYEVTLPELKLSGIDFIKAYHNNVLMIDSINIVDPTIHVRKRTNAAVKDSTKHNLLDIAMIYHEYLNVGHFNLTDANLIYADETKTLPETYNIDHISASLTNVEIDTGRFSKNDYGFDFGSADLIIADYEMTMPDSLSTVKFSEFSVSSDPFRIQLKDLELRPRGTKSIDADKPGLYAEIPYIVISEFDIARAINSDTFMIDEIYLEKPTIRIVDSGKAKSKNQQPKVSGLFGIYSSVQSYADLFFLEKFNVSDGTFSFLGSPGKSVNNIKIDQVNLNLKNLLVDKLTKTENTILGHAELDLSMEGGNINSPTLMTHLGKLAFNSSDGRLLISNLNVKQDSAAAKQQLDIVLPEMLISGIKTDQIFTDSTFVLDSLKISNVQISIDTQKKLESHTEVKLPKLPYISVNHLVLENNSLDFKTDGLPLMIAEDYNLNMSGMIIDQTMSDDPINQFDYKRINLISVKNYSFYLVNIQHLLEIKKVQWEDRPGNLSIENIRLMPYGKPANYYAINVPSIFMTGIDLKKVLKKSYYTGKNIEMEKPKIILRLSQSEKKKAFDPDLGFIPILLRNKFYGISTDSLIIRDANVKIYQESKRDSVVFEADRLNITANNFAVDSSSIVVPERFLFTDQLILDGDYISFHHRANSDFYNINHFNISTKEGDVNLNGIHFSTNNDDSNPNRDKLRFTVDDFSIKKLNFYKLTQEKIIDLNELLVNNADFFLSKGLVSDSVSVPIKSKLKLSDKEYLFDTALLKSFAAKRFLISDSKVTFENNNKEQGGFTIPDARVLAEGVFYDPVSARDSSRILYSDNLAAKISNFSYTLPDKLSSVRLGELELNLKDSLININNFVLEPLVSKYDYGPAKGYQSTWMKMEYEKITFKKVDFLKIVNQNRYQAQSIELFKPNFSIFRDMRLPFPEWQRRPLPQTELRDLNFTISVDTVRMNNAFISYQEHPPKSYSTGEVFFSDLNVELVNLTNDSIRILSMPKTNIEATTKIFNKGGIKAVFSFNLESKENIHTYGIEVDSIDLSEFNRIMIPSAGVEITSGINEKITMNAFANEKYSHGEMKFYYKDLKIALINRETETAKGFGNALGTFFANTFIIKSNNPRNFFLRKGDIFFERDEKKAIFNYWTKTFLSGVVSSLGAANNKKKMRKMQEESLKKLKESESKKTSE